MATTPSASEGDIEDQPTMDATPPGVADQQDTPQRDVGIVEDPDGEDQQRSEEPPSGQQTLAQAIEASIEQQQKAREGERLRTWLEELSLYGFNTVCLEGNVNHMCPTLSLDEYRKLVEQIAEERYVRDCMQWQTEQEAAGLALQQESGQSAGNYGGGAGSVEQSPPPPYEAPDGDRPTERPTLGSDFTADGEYAPGPATHAPE
ncbi:hypothetical protein LTR85_008090 [Meristemomyces frigidus]|nr:hypothetical protein LTR85_008090 [Meristemomyces frigidus]